MNRSSPSVFVARRLPLAVSAGLALLLAGGCAGLGKKVRREPPAAAAAPAFVEPPPAASPGADLLRPPIGPFVLGPGDIVEIEITGDPESRSAALVGPDGKIYYHVLPGLDVWGRTLAETRGALVTGLKDYYREPPNVTVTLQKVGSRRVWLLGRLAQPGVYPLTGPTTLLEAISLAGGPAAVPALAGLGDGGAAAVAGGGEEAADLGRAFVMREGRILPVDFTRLLHEGDLGHNIELAPDDLVYVPSAGAREVHVLGAVVRPGPVAIQRTPTLASVIASAGGIARESHAAQAAIVRGGLRQPRIATVDVPGILRGRVADVPLEPGDIVYVPQTPQRIVARYLDLVLTTFARTVGVNAGARAVSRGESIGISVPVGP